MAYVGSDMPFYRATGCERLPTLNCWITYLTAEYVPRCSSAGVRKGSVTAILVAPRCPCYLMPMGTGDALHGGGSHLTKKATGSIM